MEEKKRFQDLMIEPLHKNIVTPKKMLETVLCTVSNKFPQLISLICKGLMEKLNYIETRYSKRSMVGIKQNYNTYSNKNHVDVVGLLFSE